MKQISYYQSLESIREQSQKIFQLTQENLGNFILDLSKLKNVELKLRQIISRDYKDFSEIPPHSRWRHFEYGKIDRVQDFLKQIQNEDKLEQGRKLIDLFVVSVLLDAGAGNKWSYNEKSTNLQVGRSEGLCLASYDMFLNKTFSSEKFTVDSEGLKNLNIETLSSGLQIDENNQLVGLQGRLDLLRRLGSVIQNEKKYFPSEQNARPGNLIDFLLSHKDTKQNIVQLSTLWECIIHGFGKMWPEGRTKMDGVSLGDAWKSTLLNDIQPFHKLSQWLTYSLIEPLEKICNLKIIGKEKMTGLPEYRNGGLFIDTGVLTLKPSIDINQSFTVDSDVVIEWRANTICLLDKLAENFKDEIPVDTLPKVLEAGTWKLGRELAKELRPETSNPPITIISDGTVF